MIYDIKFTIDVMVRFLTLLPYFITGIINILLLKDVTFMRIQTRHRPVNNNFSQTFLPNVLSPQTNYTLLHFACVSEFYMEV